MISPGRTSLDLLLQTRHFYGENATTTTTTKTTFHTREALSPSYHSWLISYQAQDSSHSISTTTTTRPTMTAAQCLFPSISALLAQHFHKQSSLQK
jgi:hypothetical protein